MTKAQKVIDYITSECEHCKANVDLLGGTDKECMNEGCFEAHRYAIECIERVGDDD